MTARELVARARAARERAYAPYSGYRVGASVLVREGRRTRAVDGCNVENASYGLAICAERVALTAAVASIGGRARTREAMADRMVAIAIAVREDHDAAACGACRQFMHELGARMTVYLTQAKGGFRTTKVAALLPGAFEAGALSAGRDVAGAADMAGRDRARSVIGRRRVRPSRGSRARRSPRGSA